uniref:NAC domain-containing protein n=2 Tax=Quercus lobata TaxID=97700 RepID=A0A7N2QX19_QUELO
MDCDVYGDPKIWRKHFERTGMQTLYFYTKLKGRNKGKRVERATEFGTWKAQNDVKVYDLDDDEEQERVVFNKRQCKHIGSKRSFSFVARKGFDASGRWTMHEYRLDGVFKSIRNDEEYVLCQINKVEKQGRNTRENSLKKEETSQTGSTSENFECPQPVNFHNPFQSSQDEGAQYSDRSPLWSEIRW